ncbi:hypothetical protein cand_023840 [Cryptosporidium andersoni]|uniref:Rad50/SbcC-type AAA domain-containing protein n=1 Tax=Cryptosporidium andersoni TaxID=117008 RepID=A0A1J4MS21_9CRYT|nr:hypothetical protein cand_023840 [Cryptosporidium andersoni]
MVINSPSFSKWGVGKIRRVVLHNIGGHELLDIELSDSLNIITGGNGSGKSSFVSGIALLCGWSSKKAGKDTSLTNYVRNGTSKGSVRIHFSNEMPHHNDTKEDMYLYDLFGNEIIIERVIYTRGTSEYIFTGIKSDAPVYKGQEARAHLARFRSFAKIMINNPITYLTQMDAKYLIREQNSPKCLYEFFQKAHMFDVSWGYLKEEQSHLENAASVSENLRMRLEILKKDVDKSKMLVKMIEKLKYSKKMTISLDILVLLIKLKEIVVKIGKSETRRFSLIKQNEEVDLDRLHSTLKELDFEQNKLNEELDLENNKYRNLEMSISGLTKKIQEEEVNLNRMLRRKFDLNKENEQIILQLSLKKKISEDEINSEDNQTLLHNRNIEKDNIVENMTSIETDIKVVERQISLEHEKLSKLNSEIQDNKFERQKLESELDCIKVDISNNQNILINSRDSMNRILRATEDLKNKISSLKVHIKSENSFDKTHTTSKKTTSVGLDYYKSVYSYYTDSEFIALFGFSKAVHMQIQNEIALHKEFENNCIGPIGLHIFVLAAYHENTALVGLIDEIIGGKLELNSSIQANISVRKNYKLWIVANSNSKYRLLELFRKSGINIDVSLILIRSFIGKDRYDLANVSSRRPDIGMVLMDLVEISNDDVFNFLVDFCQIETTFVFYNEKDMDLIFNYKYNIKKAYCLSNRQYRFRRAGIVVAPEAGGTVGRSHLRKFLLRAKTNLTLNPHDLNINKGELRNSRADIHVLESQLRDYIKQSEFMENLIKDTGENLERYKTSTKHIEYKIKILDDTECAYKSMLEVLKASINKSESNLANLYKNKNEISIYLDEVQIDIERLIRERDRDKCIQNNDINNLNSEKMQRDILLEEVERAIKEIENSIEKVKNQLISLNLERDSQKDKLNLIENKKNDVVKQTTSIFNKLPEIKKQCANFNLEIKNLEASIESMKEESYGVKLQINSLIASISDDFLGKSEEIQVIDAEDLIKWETPKPTFFRELMEYFKWNGRRSNDEFIELPSISVVNSWRQKVVNKQEAICLEIARDTNLFKQLNYDVDIILSKEINMNILKDYNCKVDIYKNSKVEYEEEVELLLINQSNLNKRIQQLQDNHLRCGKAVNSHFKFYFSLFWSKSMKPHLLFNHDKATLNILVAPDAAAIENNLNIGNSDSLDPSKYISKEIQTLSGGESSSIGISLLLALSQNNFTPFHLFDEPDVYMDDTRRMTTVESFIQFQKRCANEFSLGDNSMQNLRQIIFVTPHSEIVSNIAENHKNIHFVQLERRQ